MMRLSELSVRGKVELLFATVASQRAGAMTVVAVTTGLRHGDEMRPGTGTAPDQAGPHER